MAYMLSVASELYMLSVIMLNVVTLSVVTLNVVTLNVIMLSVVMLNVVAPFLLLSSENIFVFSSFDK